MLTKLAKASRLLVLGAAPLVSEADTQWRAEGHRALKEGRPEAAEVAYRRALALASTQNEQVALWTDVGLALRRQERFDEALEAFDRAIALDHRSGAVWANMGVTLAEGGSYDKARLALSKALRWFAVSHGVAHEYSAAVHLSLGWLERRSGKLASSSNHYAYAAAILAAQPVVNAALLERARRGLAATARDQRPPGCPAGLPPWLM